MTKFAVLFGRADRGSLSPVDKPELTARTALRRAQLFGARGADRRRQRDATQSPDRCRTPHPRARRGEARLRPYRRAGELAIRALEEEKSLAFSLTESLNESRGSHQALQLEAHQLKQKIADLEADKDELSGSLAHLRETAGRLEGEWETLTAQANAGSLHIKDLEHQLSRAVEDVALLREQNRALADEVQKADRRLAAVEADRATTAELYAVAG